MFKKLLACAAALATLAAIPAEARTEKIKVHGASLEGNLEGNSADRDVYVFLPPSYDSNASKRYPVVYFLHGYFATADAYENLVKFQEAVDEAAAAGNELIVVLPDAHTKFKGAMYSNSVTTGDFEGFVTRDLVSHIDSNYRTLARAESRGLSGHSMGGYGTLKIVMKYPGIYSSMYAMAPCCLSPSAITLEQARGAASMTPEQIEAADFGAAAAAASLAAWAPDPNNPPNFIAVDEKDGKLSPVITARLHANSPLVLLSQSVPQLKAMTAIGIDVGDKDFLLADDTAMHNELNRFGVTHDWEVFEGDHGNRVAARVRSDLLPFFGKHLAK
ncbi:MAG TPA: alpha/beta hydrolase-fold protein [Croceibacterium sp.]|nr:alpha/beta hydrolase-fold protein [Croceibacterium sp.]